MGVYLLPFSHVKEISHENASCSGTCHCLKTISDESHVFGDINIFLWHFSYEAGHLYVKITRI